MVRPSVLALLRLIKSSYLTGACTGKSPRCSPLKMRSIPEHSPAAARVARRRGYARLITFINNRTPYTAYDNSDPLATLTTPKLRKVGEVCASSLSRTPHWPRNAGRMREAGHE
jgi:hypothetical protein